MTENTKNGLAEALMHIKALVEFAYEQGFHELGYDPVNVLETALRAREAQQAKPVAWKQRLTDSAMDEIQHELNAYRASGFPAPKDLLYRAADCIEALRFDAVDNRMAAPSEGAQRDAERLLRELVDNSLIANAESARQMKQDNPRVTCSLPVEWIDRAVAALSRRPA